MHHESKEDRRLCECKSGEEEPQPHRNWQGKDRNNEIDLQKNGVPKKKLRKGYVWESIPSKPDEQKTKTEPVAVKTEPTSTTKKLLKRVCVRHLLNKFSEQNYSQRIRLMELSYCATAIFYPFDKSCFAYEAVYILNNSGSRNTILTIFCQS